MHRAAPPAPAIGAFRLASVWAWAWLLVLPVSVRAALLAPWLKLWPAIRELAPVSNSHSLSDWPSLSRWFCSPSCCFSCALPRQKQIFRKGLRFSEGFFLYQLL